MTTIIGKGIDSGIDHHLVILLLARRCELLLSLLSIECLLSSGGILSTDHEERTFCQLFSLFLLKFSINFLRLSQVDRLSIDHLWNDFNLSLDLAVLMLVMLSDRDRGEVLDIILIILLDLHLVGHWFEGPTVPASRLFGNLVDIFIIGILRRLIEPLILLI